jgi:hypothetical protein
MYFYFVFNLLYTGRGVTNAQIKKKTYFVCVFFSYGFDITPYIVIKITPLFKVDSTTNS